MNWVISKKRLELMRNRMQETDGLQQLAANLRYRRPDVFFNIPEKNAVDIKQVVDTLPQSMHKALPALKLGNKTATSEDGLYPAKMEDKGENSAYTTRSWASSGPV